MSVPVEKRVVALDNSMRLVAATDKRLYAIKRMSGSDIGDPARAAAVDGQSPSEVAAFLATQTVIDIYDNPDLTGTPVTQPILSDAGQYAHTDGLYWHEGGQVDYYCPDDPVRNITPAGVGMQDTAGWINVNDCRGYGDGTDEDAYDIACIRASILNQDVYFGPTSEPYRIAGGDRTKQWIRPGVSIHGSGYAGRIIRDGDFTKAQGLTYFYAGEPTDIGYGVGEASDDVVVENLYIDGNTDEIILATGLLDGEVTFGTSNTHTTTEASGIVKLKSCTGTFGVPATNPTFGVAVLGNQVVRYTGVTNNGTANITLTGCYGGTGTKPDNTDAAEHSGNMRMPAFNFNLGGERITFQNNTIINFPGQPFQGANISDYKVLNSFSLGNRGCIIRYDSQNGIISGNYFTATDDVIAIAALDGDAPPSVQITNNIFRSLPNSLGDTDAEPEYAGNGVCLYGCHDSIVAFNQLIGSGTTIAAGNDKSAIKIADGGTGSTSYCENVAVYANEIQDSNGYGIRIGSRGTNKCNNKNVTVSENLIVSSNLQGIFLALNTADSVSQNIRIEANDLIDCGINAGAYDTGAIRTVTTAGAYYVGLYFLRNNIVRPGRHALLCDSDLLVYDGAVSGNRVQDPNVGNDASTSVFLLHGFNKATIRSNEVKVVSGKAFTVVASSNVFTSTAHGFVDTDEVVLLAPVTGSAGITAPTHYFIRDATTDTFKLAATSGGAAIDITTDGSGKLGSTVLHAMTINNTCTKLARTIDQYFDPEVLTSTAIVDNSTSPVTLV